MGRGKRKGAFFHNKKSKQANLGATQNYVKDDRDTKRENKRFEEYYKAQGIVPENEWEEMFDAFKDHLPSSFRIHVGGAFGEKVKQRFKEHFQAGTYPHKVEDKIGREVVIKHAPMPIPWYPNENGWKLGLSTVQLRKLKVPEYQALHRYIVRENTAGSINRQEEVSMIPPFFLDVKPHHIVLDMCASPGSKTQQIIEQLHAEEIHGTIPTGAVVANDADSRRAYMLVSQCKRLNTCSLTVTNHPAQFFPDVAQYDYNKERLKGTPRDSEEGTFDRILADVPCSGDGTMRKSPDMWRNWNEGGGMVLHGTQLKILKRGLRILKPGGILVYSTCSLNPIENEAVVAAAIEAAQGTVEVVDVSEKYPELKRRPGMTSWKVGIPNFIPKKKQVDGASSSAKGTEEIKTESSEEPKTEPSDKPAEEPTKFFTFFRSIEEYKNREPNEKVPLKKKYIEPIPSMFCPPTVAEAEKLGLPHCMRIVPHDQDTGGFFVCVLRKNAVIPKPPGSKPVETASEEKPISKGGSVPDFVPVKRRRGDAPPQSKYNALQEDNWKMIRDYYGLNDSFPSNCLYSRSDSESVGNVIFASQATVDTAMRANNANKLYVVSLGVSVFKRSERALHGCVYRLVNSGIHYIVPFMTKQVVKVALRDLELVIGYRLKVKLDSEEARKVDAANPGAPLCRLSTAAQESAKGSAEGCIALALTDEDQKKFAATFGYNFYMPAWLGVRTINPMANLQEITVLSEQMEEAGVTVGAFEGMDATKDKEAAIFEMKEVATEKTK